MSLDGWFNDQANTKEIWKNAMLFTESECGLSV